ncbi:MAG: hypothetical protein RBU45_07970 [Myxococcota bacterium]|jgi:hypothetical protein|nr:hypothetical protein [Myxococcota bacterium]
MRGVRSAGGWGRVAALALAALAAGCPPQWDRLPPEDGGVAADAGQPAPDAAPVDGGDGGDGGPGPVCSPENCPPPQWICADGRCIIRSCYGQANCPEGSRCLPEEGSIGLCTTTCDPAQLPDPCLPGGFCTSFEALGRPDLAACLPAGGIPTGSPCVPFSNPLEVITATRGSLCQEMSCTTGAAGPKCSAACKPEGYSADGRALSRDCDRGEQCSFPGDLYIPTCALPGPRTLGEECLHGYECETGICMCANHPCASSRSICTRVCLADGDCPGPSELRCLRPGATESVVKFCLRPIPVPGE